ncbi:MAG: stage V sporulation protein D [Peptococcaceae bacterium]|jgi:stage V sporulation protein D (sporulation-specific penicillin-binding protein)|nr:stage V sporulation protein D [Peptococcaceae bacterium]MDH7524362.1 stage V sporulation protein D [Peptococcaceae bacterium]
MSISSIRIRKRITLVFLLVLILMLCLSLRLVWVQFVIGEELREKAFQARYRNVEVKAKRGMIYDAKGKPLAISVSTDSFYAIPAQVRKSGRAEETAAKIAQVLNMEKGKVLEAITRYQAFVWIQRHVPDEKARILKELNLEGISYVEEPERFYPNGQLLSHVLGFCGIDNQGLNGIEVTYEKVLSGSPGAVMVEYDARGQEIPDALYKYVPPQDGNSIFLTIDETIQYIVERELDEIMKLRNPKRAGAIIMDPKTGRVLAMAVRPSFDPNKYKEYDQSLWRNFLISDVYEPGSTFKTVTAAGALDEGVVKPNDRFYCSGFIKVGKETVKCWRYGRPHGSQSFAEGVQNSCNPVFVTVALREGKDIFYRYLYGFGFGQKTGIELPGEAVGILVDREKCKDIDLATMSIGQANAVTPIQLLTAFAAIANGGYLMKPQLVKEIRDREGRLVKTVEPQAIRQVISSDTSRVFLNILETVVSQGTGKNAYVEGYRVGGKTGTAQKIIPGGGYSTTEYIASFLGAAPVNDPQIVGLVVVDSPQGVYFGGQVAAPAFGNIVRDTLRYLQVPAQVEPGKIASPSKKAVVLPNMAGLEVKEAVQRLEKLKLKQEVVGDGTKVKTQLPQAGSEVREGSEVVLYTGIPAVENSPESVAIPDLTGKTLGEIRDLTKLLNLNLEVQGSGVVVRQEPEPGQLVPVGSNITIVMEPLTQNAMEQYGP